MQEHLTKTQLESGEYHRDIWDLDLFQSYSIDDLTEIKRVPGGFVFLQWMNGEENRYEGANTIFIPYSEEFRPGGSTPEVPRVGSIVYFDSEDEEYEKEVREQLTNSGEFIFNGEIPNMPGHCTVTPLAGPKAGIKLVGFHTDNFKEQDQ